MSSSHRLVKEESAEGDLHHCWKKSTKRCRVRHGWAYSEGLWRNQWRFQGLCRQVHMKQVGKWEIWGLGWEVCTRRQKYRCHPYTETHPRLCIEKNSHLHHLDYRHRIHHQTDGHLHIFPCIVNPGLIQSQIGILGRRRKMSMQYIYREGKPDTMFASVCKSLMGRASTTSRSWCFWSCIGIDHLHFIRSLCKWSLSLH